jgi:predicted esterase
MKTFTKPGLLILGLFFFISMKVHSQTGVLDPADAINVYNPLNPPATPPYGTLAKWVKTNRVSFDATSFKAYFYKGVAFRLKFPKTYQHGVNDGKKYPLILFFHGRGERGTIYDNEYQIFHGGNTHRTAVDQGKFDGFLFYPQTTSDDGFFTSGELTILRELIENYFIPQIKVDVNRIIVDGLSGGGSGTWVFSVLNPTLVAAATPISPPIGTQVPSNGLENLKFTPIWQFQGGRDESPSPAETQLIANMYLNAGANYKWTLYPNLGHSCWNAAWAEVDYWPFNNRAHKANPWTLTGKTEFCAGDAINATIGVTPGFSGYEWRKNGVVIPGASGNQINVTEVGVYDCRVRRGTEWTEWSPIPVNIKIKLPTVTPPITLAGLGSNVIPVPDGNTGAMLKVPGGYVTYEWQKVGSNTVIGTDSTYYATTPGEYRVRVTELFGCSSDFSPAFTVIDANGSNHPEPATSITATTLSKTSLRLDWTDNPSPAFNETGYEIYQSTALELPFQLVTITGADVNTLTFNGLAANTKYYYKIRAVNNAGASAVSEPVFTTTEADISLPTTPYNLRITKTTKNSISLAWEPSTDDVGILSYDLFFNGTKVLATTSTAVTVYNLEYKKYYNIIVKAKDLSKNYSEPSNQVTGYTVLFGYNYKHYTGAWDFLPNFSTLTPVTTGNTANISLSPRIQDNNIGFLWEGFINVPVDGTYTFRTNSDDGSKLYIGALNQKTSAYDFNATALVDNDGVHGTQNRDGSINLVAGNYPIAIAYFNRSSGRSISVSLRTPLSGSSFAAIPDSWLFEIPEDAGTPPARPSQLVATVQSNKAIALSWSDNSANETAFEIYRSQSPYDGYVYIASEGANTTQYIDSGLLSATRYYYRVKAVNQYGESDWANSYAEAIWTFNNDFFDLSGNNRTLTTAGTPLIDNTEKIEGGQSVRLNGSTQYLNIPTADGFLKNAYSEKTVAFWMKADQFSNNTIVFDIGGSDDGLAARFDNGQLIVGVAANSVRRSISIPFNNTNWTHIAVVYKGSVLKLFVNGVEAGVANNLGFTAMTTTTNASRIGANDNSNAFNIGSQLRTFSGWLDHFGIYSAAFTADEVAAQMNNTLYFSNATTLAAPREMTAPYNVIATGISPRKVQVAWQHQTTKTDTTTHPETILKTEAESYAVQNGVSTENCSEGGLNVRSIDANDWMEYNINIPHTGTYALNLRASATNNNTDHLQLRKLDGTVLATVTIPNTGNAQTWTTVTVNVNLTAGAQVLRVFALKNNWNLNWFELTTPGFSAIDTTTVTPSSFEVYRSTQQDDSYALIGTVPASDNTYTDSAVNANSVYYYKVKAKNDDGVSGYSGADSAKTLNSNPTVKTITSRTMRFGTELDLQVEAADVDGDALTISFQNLPAFASYNAGTIHFAPAEANTGVYENITVYAADGHGGLDSTKFTLTVNDNFIPVIVSAGNVTVTEKEVKVFKLTSSDQNTGEELTWSFKGLPSFAAYVANTDSAVITLTPGYADNGNHAITAYVNDGRGGVDSAEFNITVNDVNPGKTIYVNFSDGTHTVPGNWNNTAKMPAANDLFANLKDANGTGTGINMNLVTAWTGINNQGMNTGNNSGAYPDAAIVSSYYTTTVQTVRLTGLPKGKYNFAFLGSRANPLAGVGVTGQYTIGSQVVTLNAANNAQNVATINNVEPSADSIINITVQRATGSSFAYLNVMEIQYIYDDSTAPAKPRNLTVQLDSQKVKLNWVDAAYNESGYGVYKATNAAGPYTLLNAPATTANLEQYTDATVTGGATYYYFLRLPNNYGVTYSDTVSIATPNLAPVITAIPNQLVNTNEIRDIAITATDSPGDQITLSASGLPAFASFTDNGNGSGTLHIAAGTQKGLFGPVTITAADGAPLEASKQFTIKVISADTSITFVNFNQTEPAPAPWNNMNSAPNASVSLTNLKDEGDQSTGMTLTLLDKWSAANNLGVVTGNNSGIYPDVVMKTFYYEGSPATKRIRLSGLSATKRYTLVFFASRADYGSALITRYNVGAQSVELDANNNSSRTVKLTALTPDANGEILVNVNRVVGPVAYLGAMEIHSYASDGSPSAPIVTALGLSKSKIQLNWSPAGADVTAYRIYRSDEANGTYSLIDEVPASTLSYTDQGLSTGTAYYYKMITMVDASQSPYSAIAAARTMLFNLNINFNDGSSGAPAQPAWNNTNALIGDGFTMNNLLSDGFASTGINMTLTVPFSGFNTLGATTGNNTGVVPDNVMKSFYYLNFADTAKLKITGLSPAMTYNFVFFGSRGNPNAAVNVTTAYRIGNETVTLDCRNNTMNTIQINNVRADESGAVEISITATQSGGFGYLNSLSIQGTSGVDPIPAEQMAASQIVTSARTAGNVTETTTTNNNAVENMKAAIVADAYPNPFVNDVTLRVKLEKQVPKLSVAVMDISGKIIHRREFSNVSSGIWQQRIGLDGSRLSKGVYLIRVDTGIEKPALIKMIK